MALKVIAPEGSPRKFIIPGSHEETIRYSVNDLVKSAQEAIAARGAFYLALSGGSTPKAIYQALAKDHKKSLDWSKVSLFWSDERSVPPTDPESNYHMAMENGMQDLGIPNEQIFRMPADAVDTKEAAEAYENLILSEVPNGQFDFIMLGMGDDGHTASLFPGTLGLNEEKRLVIINHVPQKNTDRMTFTYPCLNQAHKVRFYVLGASKAPMLHLISQATFMHGQYPSLGVGTKERPAEWVIDAEAASLIKED